MNEIHLGIDIGSTTVKLVAVRDGKIIYQVYARHMAKVREKTCELLRGAAAEIDIGCPIRVALTGSAGLGVAKACQLEFVQEVFAVRQAVGTHVPAADVVIELGGEDAKIIFLTGRLEERMNGSCAGGTGAFIDQMAVLLNTTAPDLDVMSADATRTYAIASRCGVFAKTDIQPLLNEGANKADIAASIFQAVVNQTLSGLAQGRKVEGDVVFLGGPLFFFKGLQKAFQQTLQLSDEHAHFPALAPYAVAAGAATCAATAPTSQSFDQLVTMIEQAARQPIAQQYLPPLFTSEAEYTAFSQRHKQHTVDYSPLFSYTGDAYLGVDCGSTTTKLVVIDRDYRILYEHYAPNQGNPVDVLRDQLSAIYALMGDRVRLVSSAVTGYGEALIQAGFGVDLGLVETVAHFRAAHHFNPAVDFIIDIGGQDIKCFQIRNGAVDNIFLNEACSSGCGSFIETFARSMGYTVQDFCKLGLYASAPLDLGSRCTVFMNSSVKQGQKDGVPIDCISAGLSLSVVKNALYKVIRARSAQDLGKHIVVQGGTFLNDAILRAFEQELQCEVVRPSISGLMGAYGAALYAMENAPAQSTLISAQELEHFTHTTKNTRCGLCTNHCSLTISTFSNQGRFLSGNRCERPTGRTASADLPNLFTWKYDTLCNLPVQTEGHKIGLPMGLNFYELLPFWQTLFTRLGFAVVHSDRSSRELYMAGQHSIPSDTACYPAKLMHGHIESLLQKGVDTIFYPCMSYNLDEHRGDNCYNCPVVAYYPELLQANVPALQDVRFLMPYFELNHHDKFVHAAEQFLIKQFPALKRHEVKVAVHEAYKTLEDYEAEIRAQGERAVAYAQAHDLPIAVLAGRPYHIDPEINHGIHQMLATYGMVVVSEDSIAHLGHMPKLHVLNQWTYHARLYAAADFVAHTPNAHLIQLVSFGCGLDAITTDEVRTILEKSGKIYTQLKIDEINNLGAAKIRIRSMLATAKEGE